MSTFMGLAWIDLMPGADTEKTLAQFRGAKQLLQQESKDFAPEAEVVRLPEGRDRIQVVADRSYAELADLVVWLIERIGLISHAFIAFDHDEYGAEHLVIDALDGQARRVYHYFAYPRDEEDGEYYDDGDPCLETVPGIEEPAEAGDPGVLVDGRASRARLAALYGVPQAEVDRAAEADASAHENIGIIGLPCEHWREALGLAWPGEDV